MHLRTVWLSIPFLALAAACGHSDRSASSTPATPPPKAPAAVAASAPTAGGKPACPATGLWAECSVLDRLDRRGLAPRRDSGAVHEDPLTQPGMRVHLGRDEVEIFIYPDSASRKADEAKLDRRRFITPDQEPTLAGERTIIESANLLALLKSQDDHKRERVADDIMSGPPQP